MYRRLDFKVYKATSDNLEYEYHKIMIHHTKLSNMKYEWVLCLSHIFDKIRSTEIKTFQNKTL